MREVGRRALRRKMREVGRRALRRSKTSYSAPVGGK